MIHFADFIIMMEIFLFFLEPFIIDFTLSDDNQLSILELGLLQSSGTAGYNALYPETSIANHLLAFYKEKTGNNTTIINFTDSNMSGNYFSIQSTNAEQQLLLSKEATFGHSLSSHYAADLATCLILGSKVLSNSTNNILICIPPKLFHENLSELSRIEQANNHSSNIHISSAIPEWTAMCKNKAILAKHLTNNPLSPKTFTGQMGESREKLIEFLNETKASHYVLKPIDQSCGRGVVILEESTIESFFESIDNQVCGINFWQVNPKADYVLQVCHPSKMIVASNGARYRPTGRLVFAPYFENGTIKFDLLGSYWKLPEQSLDLNTGYSTDNLVSKISSRKVAGPISEKITADDLAIILEQFNQYFPPVVNQLFTYDAREKELAPNPIAPSLDDFIKALYSLVFEKMSYYDGTDKCRNNMIALLLAGLPIINNVDGYHFFSQVKFSSLLALWFNQNQDYFNYLLKNSLEDYQIKFFMNHLDMPLVTHMRVQRLSPTALEGFETGFSLTDIQSNWFKYAHIEAVQKYGLTIDEARFKSCITICNITKLIKKGSSKEEAISQACSLEKVSHLPMTYWGERPQQKNEHQSQINAVNFFTGQFSWD